MVHEFTLCSIDAGATRVARCSNRLTFKNVSQLFGFQQALALPRAAATPQSTLKRYRRMITGMGIPRIHSRMGRMAKDSGGNFGV